MFKKLSFNSYFRFLFVHLWHFRYYATNTTTFLGFFLWDNSLKVSFQKNCEVFVTIWCLTPLQSLLADPGKDRGCSTSSSVIHSFIYSVIHWWFGKISLRRRHALMVADGHKIEYVYIFRRFQILKSLHIALLVPKLPRFCLMVDFDYWWSSSGEVSASAACASP